MLDINKINAWVAPLTRMITYINIIHSKEPSLNLNKFRNWVTKSATCRGRKDTIDRLKAFRLALQQYSLLQTVTPIPFCKADRDGFPKAIAFLKPDRNDVNSIRYSMSIMRACESLLLAPEYKVDTITDKSSADKNLVEEICKFIETWSGIKVLPPLKPGNFVLSNKAGPNGPASLSCLEDLAALRKPENKVLLNSIEEMLEIALPFFKTSNYDTSKYDSSKLIHSKLVLLQDKFGKTRIIAIADYLSNISLTPLHNSFMQGLRSLRCDVTYHQNDIPALIKELGNHLFSSDMTAFTDRFPREIEEAVIKAAYGDKISDLWSTILTSRDFTHRNGAVRYNTGNPMGVLSSWAVSTYAHHAVKQYCAHKLGLNYKKYKYLILGDDTLDSDINVYNYYIDTIKRIGVSISTSKCTQSRQGYAEFAKRMFSPQGEVTGLPVHLLEGINKRPEQFLELYRMCISRGYDKEYIKPGLLELISRQKHAKMLTDILSLPKHITKVDPLFEVQPGTYAESLVCLDEGVQAKLLTLSRESMFWSIVNNIDSVTKRSPSVSQLKNIEPNHPLIFALSEQCERYLPQEAYISDFEVDEFYIYNKWMEGEYVHLLNLPSVDTYRYYNRGHRVTKCNFDVFRTLLALANGNCNIPLHSRVKRTNDDLYDLALGRCDPRM